MPNMTLSIDAQTHRFIQTHKSVNWSEVAREAFRRKARELHMWDDLLANSQLTQAEAVEIGDDIKSAVMKRLGW
jgi:hypothetical protein